MQLTEEDRRLRPVMTEFDALFHALTRARRACVLGSVEDAKQGLAEMRDAVNGIETHMSDLFQKRDEAAA